MPQETPKSSVPLIHDFVLAWIKQQAIPVATLDFQGSLDDLTAFQQVVGNASIIGLGEASHGVHEFFTMKHRLLAYLVERMGFTMFAMEMGWMHAELLNDYVLTGEGNARELLKSNGYGIWYTQEVLDLVEWIRAYNADPQHIQKVYFAGFDGVGIEGAGLNRIVQFFQQVDPQHAGQIEALYQDMPRSSAESYLSTSAEVGQKNAQAAQQVCTWLNEHKDAYIARSSPQAFATTVQEAHIVEYVAQRIANPVEYDPLTDLTSFMDAYQRRDHFMAENVCWLHEHAEGGAKMVLWAHNCHIGTWGGCSDSSGKNWPFTWMGQDLRQHYGEQYLTVGFSFNEGAINAYPINPDGTYPDSASWRPFTIKPAAPGSYEETLVQAGSQYLLDLRAAPPGETRTWLDGPHPIRVFDTDYLSDEHRFYQIASLPAWYDVLVHIQQISPSQMLSKEEGI